MPASAVFDLHCDTLTAFMDPTRCRDTLDDPLSSFALSKIPQGVSWCQCCAIFIPDGLTPKEAEGYYAFHQRSFIRQMGCLSSQVLPCRTADDICRAWDCGKAAVILTVENGAALGGRLERIERLARDGVRMMTLTWNGENELGSGHETDRGLSSFGKAAVQELERQGILVDVSHLNDQGFEDLLDISEKPFVASHSNARSVCGHRRNLTDWQIREMAARGCLIGLNYYSPFLRSDGCPAGLEDLYRHAAHFLDLGAENCLALGSDFDGADLPPCLDSPIKEAGLWDYLTGRRIPPTLVQKIMYQNALNFFRAGL